MIFVVYGEIGFTFSLRICLFQRIHIFLHLPERLNTRRSGVIKKSPFGGFRGLLLRVGRVG